MTGRLNYTCPDWCLRDHEEPSARLVAERGKVEVVHHSGLLTNTGDVAIYLEQRTLHLPYDDFDSPLLFLLRDGRRLIRVGVDSAEELGHRLIDLARSWAAPR